MAEVDRNELLFWETDDVSDWRLLVVLEDLVVRLTFETNVIEQHERRGRYGKMVSMRVVKM